jgi:hypothetical protein
MGSPTHAESCSSSLQNMTKTLLLLSSALAA